MKRRHEDDFEVKEETDVDGSKHNVNVPPPPPPPPIPVAPPQMLPRFPPPVISQPPQPTLRNGQWQQRNLSPQVRTGPGPIARIPPTNTRPMQPPYIRGNLGNRSNNLGPAGSGGLRNNTSFSNETSNNNSNFSNSSNGVPQGMRMQQPYQRGNNRNFGGSNRFRPPNSQGMHRPNFPFQYDNYGQWNPRSFHVPPPTINHGQQNVNSMPPPQNVMQPTSSQSSSSTESNTQAQSVTQIGDEIVTKTKGTKRRPMSQSYPSRPWNREDAQRALNEESNHAKNLRKQSLIIRFPDPDLNKEIVKTYHDKIENVHFQVPSGPRYCFVQLKEDCDVEQTIQELQCIEFNGSFLRVERKIAKNEEELSPESIDPYTLYIGNLPANVNVAAVKEKFPQATRIDIGFAQRMKFTRYAFIRYNNVDDAIKAYRDSYNLILDSRSIIVRFRRLRGHVGLPGETKPQKAPKDKTKKKVKKDQDDPTALSKLQDQITKLQKQIKGSKADGSKALIVKENELEDDDEDEDDDDDDDDDEDEEEDDDEDEDDDDDEDEEDDDDDDDDEEEVEEEEEEEEEEDDEGGPMLKKINKSLDSLTDLDFNFF